MFRICPSRLFVSIAALVSLLSGSGCADDQELFIIKNAVPLDENCGVDTATLLIQDTLDVSLDGPFGIGLLLENVQTNNAQSNTGLDDDGELKIEYAEVRLTPTEGNAPAGLDTSFEVPLATSSLGSGEEIGIFVQVPASVTASLASTVPADGTLTTLEMGVVIVADRTAQVANGKLGEVRSREFVFPFTVCNGCLTGCVPACGMATASNCVEDEGSDTSTTGP
ncbi:hypothetical protein ACNOYE_06395 [Nannocystaceae bacterium ST9]